MAAEAERTTYLTTSAKAKLRADELETHYPATHQIVFRVTPGAAPRSGMTVEFDGATFKVVAIGDPHAGDDLMKRKFVKLIVHAV